MPSLYDVIADSCAALAAKAKHKSDKVQLLQLADQWRTVPADRQGPGKKPPASVVPVTDNVNRATLLSRPAPQGPGCRLDSASDEIEERNKQLESKTERAKKEAVERARDAIGVLRELGIDVDTILEDLGFSDGAQTHETRPGKLPKKATCSICNFQTNPAHDGRAHHGQSKKKPLTAKELEKKGLTKV
jgi:hypothetical protein